MSLQLLVIMVPVLFGFMGFALDLGRLYLIRGELNQAANAMALAAASQLLGTAASPGNATSAAQVSLDDSSGAANKYNFGSITVGQSNGNLNSTVNSPAFFATLVDATAPGAALGGNQADGTTARHVVVSLTADAPLLFFSLLPGGESRKTPIAAQAVAGISAPVCVACGIEPFAVAALDPSDSVNFGFGDPTGGTLYTFAFTCQGNPQPATLASGATVLPYVVINRLDSGNANADSGQQLYRAGAGGLMASTNPNPTGSAVPIGCAALGDTAENLWGATFNTGDGSGPSIVPNVCGRAAPQGVVQALCGLQSRLDNTDPSAACNSNVTDFATLAAAYPPDPDQLIAQADPYSTYLGNGRRVLTLPIVNAVTVAANGTMTILGFRQFFLERNADGSPNTPSDPSGRFVAMYIGSPAPVKQGFIDDRFGTAAGTLPLSGPGKVVLHQ
jgi:Flp pilus assembly protein TadG